MWLSVAVPVPLYQTFTYASDVAVAAGCRVKVSFAARTLVGVVVADAPTPTQPSKIKPLLEVLDTAPVLCASLLKLMQRAAQYYHQPIGEVAALMLPVWLRNGHSLPQDKIQYYQLTDAGRAADPLSLTRAPKQAAILQLLAQDPQTAAKLKASASSIKPLLEKGWIESQVKAAAPFLWQQQMHVQNRLGANPQQAVAISAIHLAKGTFAAFLLEGVTGSGKTEVYLQVIEHCLSAGQQVLLLVPEIGLTPQMVARFEQRFGIAVAVLHSKISDRQRAVIWQQARTGTVGIVIGTRSALFTPFAALGLIVIDEEHDDSFKQQEGVRYHARDLALLRGQLENCPVVMGTATPSLETLHNALQGRYHHLRLDNRAGVAAMPAMQVLDIRHQPIHFGLSEALIQEIRKELATGNQVLVFVNRRGYAPAIICHRCGKTVDCPACDVPYTYHLSSKRMHCHLCASVRRLPTHCQHCGSNDLVLQGIGTEQVEEGLNQLFADVPQVRIDSDAVRAKTALSERLAAINAGQYQLLVGTQILSKGHHFPHVTLVAIVDCDGALFSADFRASERLGQLITQLAGRAGRHRHPGRMILQTHNPEHPLLQDLVQNGYAHFARHALTERRGAGLPPFSFQIALRAEASEKVLPYTFLQQCRQALMQQSAGLSLLGPLPALQEKKQGRYRFILILQGVERAPLHKAVAGLLPRIKDFTDNKKIRWAIDVDPQDFY